jgi:hypothetical protein
MSVNSTEFNFGQGEGFHTASSDTGNSPGHCQTTLKGSFLSFAKVKFVPANDFN